MTETRTKTVTVVRQEQYESGPFDFGTSYTDGSLNKVIDSLLEIRDSIPPEYRDKAWCEINSESSYEGSHCATIEVSFVRPETPLEAAARESDEAARLASQEAKERAAYEQLKRKFGP